MKYQAEFHEVIRAENVTKTYANGVTALTDINLSVRQGEIIGVLGTSGSGKTTLFRLFNGALMPTGGELTVLGKQMQRLSYTGLKKLRTEMSVVYQHHNIIPGLSVVKNVLLGKLGKLSFLQALRMAAYVKDKELEEVSRILEWLGLSEKIFDRATDLSGGEQQRVAIARALLGETQLILADEPVSSVDYLTAQSILNLFSRLNKESNTTVMMNLHQQDAALNYCSRIIVMDRGRKIYDGPPGEWIGKGEAGNIACKQA